MSTDPAARFLQWFVAGVCVLCFTLSAGALP